MSIANVFSTARDAFDMDDTKKAKGIINEVLSQHIESPYAAHAVEIYLDYEMFDDAVNVFVDFKNRTGKPLRCDYSVAEIKSLKKNNYEVKKEGYSTVFEYMTIRERGFLSGMRRLFPIKKILINDKSITFTSLFSTEKFLWKEMESLSLFKQKTQISVGNPYWQKIMVFDFGKKRKIIDVTSGLPDYKGNILLMAFLKQRFDILEVNNKRLRIFNWPGAFVIIGCVAMGGYIFLKDFGYL